MVCHSRLFAFFAGNSYETGNGMAWRAHRSTLFLPVTGKSFFAAEAESLGLSLTEYSGAMNQKYSRFLPAQKKHDPAEEREDRAPKEIHVLAEGMRDVDGGIGNESVNHQNYTEEKKEAPHGQTNIELHRKESLGVTRR